MVELHDESDDFVNLDDFDEVLGDENSEENDSKNPSFEISPPPTSSGSDSAQDSLYKEYFHLLDESKRAEILSILYRAEIPKNDVIFPIAFAMRFFEQTIDEKPKELDLLFSKTIEKLTEKLEWGAALFEEERKQIEILINDAERRFELQSKAALDSQSRNISGTVSTLVKKAAFDKVALNAAALIQAGVILLGAIGFGITIGLGLPLFAKPPELDPTGPRQLSLDEAIALNWATTPLGKSARENPEVIRWALSSDGEYAREFMSWNQSLLSKTRNGKLCEEDLKELGITLNLEGKVAKSGFCTLWIEPPSRREFITN